MKVADNDTHRHVNSQDPRLPHGTGSISLMLSQRYNVINQNGVCRLVKRLHPAWLCVLVHNISNHSRISVLLKQAELNRDVHIYH